MPTIISGTEVKIWLPTFPELKEPQSSWLGKKKNKSVLGHSKYSQSHPQEASTNPSQMEILYNTQCGDP